jgi:leucyl aminopeptidase
VGKGITFDSGGLSIKPWKSMEWMKQDMSGAAAVFATVRSRRARAAGGSAWVRRERREHDGGGAQKPGDIITYRNGTTAEVLNTDAEGRLVLGDALCLAAEEKPDCIIDLATLTAPAWSRSGRAWRSAWERSEARRHADRTRHEMRRGSVAAADRRRVHGRHPLLQRDIQKHGLGWAGTITAALFCAASWAIRSGRTSTLRALRSRRSRIRTRRKAAPASESARSCRTCRVSIGV